MVNPLLAGGRWFAQRPLIVQILSLVFAASLIIVVTVGHQSYSGRKQDVMQDSVQWAKALSVMASRTTSAYMLERDYGSMELIVRDLVDLPGMMSVTVVQPGGKVAMKISGSDGDSISRYPENELAEVPSASHWFEADHIHAIAALGEASSDSPTSDETSKSLMQHGWVDIEISYADRLEHALSQWKADAATLIVFALGMLGLFAIFLKRVFGPISSLADFAATMSKNPGATVRMRWGSLEVRELGRALNTSSQELERQITSQHTRFTRLQAILDTAADAIIGVSASGRITSTNPAGERIFGKPQQELIGQPLDSLLIGMNEAKLAETIENGMLIHSTQSRIGKVEINALRHGGIEFPVEVLLGDIPSDSDVRYVCIVRDLSDTKLAEEYLTLYSRAVDCALNGIAISDARRYPQPYVYANQSFSRITGYALHEVMGRNGTMLEGAETDKDDLQLLARRVQAGDELTIVLKNYRKGGVLFHNKLSVSPVRNTDGEITHYINVIEDVTSQVEVKQRLIERTARLNATFDLSPDGFAVFDRSGELITSNPAFRAMVGDVPTWCSLGRFDSWFRTLCEDPASCRPINESIADGRKDVIALSHPAPKVIEREIRKNLGGSGETILYFRDVTHQVEVDRIKSEFLATAAHELRTPLASILGFTELLLHRKFNEERQKDMLQTVHRQGTLLQNLIQELLDLSRIEARQGKDFHIVPTSLGEIVENAVKGITNVDAGRVVQMDTPLPLLTVMADSTKIEQALTNLLSNAFKYSPDGGMVSLRAEETSHDGDPCVLIHVCDQGIGMTPEQLDRAFERFFRADTSGNIPGTGLGLNLVKEIAEIHGGDVSLASQIGVGTVATLRLRLATADMSEQLSPAT